MSEKSPNASRKESPGAKKKEERIIEGSVELNLSEKLSVIMNFWVQPSLKAAFIRACQQIRPYPLGPSDVLRQMMVEFVERQQATDSGKS